MTVEKLKRVLWRLRATRPNTNIHRYKDLRIAVMKEIGTDIRTYHRSRESLRKLSWIKSHTAFKFELTNKDLEES